jgi:hypothetical protein
VQRAFELVDEPTEVREVVAQNRYYLLRLGRLRKSREPPQITEQHGHISAVAVQELFARGQNDLGNLRRQESLEAAHAFDLGDLLRDALLERAVPVGEFARLPLHLVMKLLEAQDRSHARYQRGLIDRLGQIFVGPGLEPRDHIPGIGPGRHQNDGHERQLGILLEPAADLDAVDLGHHYVEQDQIRGPFFRGSERFLSVGRLHELIAVWRKSSAENVAVRLVVVDD